MKLSVIIAVYNQEELIKRAIESIPEDCEIIIIDDCSTDNTVKVVETNYPEVILIKNKKNLGAGLTRNKGIDVAKGEYVVFLDSDDYFYTHEFKKILKHMDGVNDMIFFDMILNNGSRIRLFPDNFRKYVGMNKIIKRDFIGDTRFPDMRTHEDRVFTHELGDKKGKHFYTYKLCYHYNFPREGSLMWEYSHGVKSDQ